MYDLWNVRKKTVFVKIASSVKLCRWLNLNMTKKWMETKLKYSSMRPWVQAPELGKILQVNSWMQSLECIIEEKCYFWKLPDKIVSNQMKCLVPWMKSLIWKRSQRPSINVPNPSTRRLIPLSLFSCINWSEGDAFFKEWPIGHPEFQKCSAVI